MAEEILICPICKAALSNASYMRAGGLANITCANCGDYYLAREFHRDFIEPGQLDASELAKLSYSIRRMQGSGSGPILSQELASNILQSTILPTALEQLDNLIIYLGRVLNEPGDASTLEPYSIKAVLGSITDNGSAWILDQAKAAGLIQGQQSASGEIYDATLTIRGWSRFEELQTSVAGVKRAFMAMKFGDEELTNVFVNCFKSAAKRAGFELMKLDDEPRAGLIDDRLRLEIRTSRFLIADLSHANNGAYWEAGYAEGLGRPVIYTCKQSIFESGDPAIKPHFDTNHHLIIPWNPSDLQAAEDRLATTIRVTLPSEAILED